MPLHSRKMLGLVGAMKDMMGKHHGGGMKDMMRKHHGPEVVVSLGKEEGGDKDEVIRHHLDDIKEALMKCFKALESKDLKEVVDNAVIIQSSSLDVEELITGKEPKT